MIYYSISLILILILYQNTNIIVMKYFRYNILISQYEYWKDQYPFTQTSDNSKILVT